MNCKSLFTLTPFIFSVMIHFGGSDQLQQDGRWIEKPPEKWPQITMINQIDYINKYHPVAGCGFLLDTGKDTIAVTAKHILTYFKSEKMDGVDFKATLKSWKMAPKNNLADVVLIDKLINKAPDEPINRVPSSMDWLLFSVKEMSPNIQPLKFRTEPFVEGEAVYIVGWRYSDKNCAQVIYEGRFVKSEEGSLLISTKKLADNTMPGLSGSPVIDSRGRLIGLMSQKAGKMERLSSIEYPKKILQKKGYIVK